MSTEKQLDMLDDDPIKDEIEAIPEVEKVEDEPQQLEEAVEEEIPLEKGIEELRAQLQQAETARMEAERREREAIERANRHSIDARDTQLQLVSSAIDDLKKQQSVWRQQKVEALAMGDYEKVAEIDESIIEARTNLTTLETYKRDMENAPAPRYEAPPVDPVEAIASQLSQKSAAWVRAHPEFARDEAKKMRMVKAHEFAVSNGYVADSDEYFEYVEGLLGVRTQQEESPLSAAAAPRRAAPVAAPVSRGSSGAPKNGYRLTAAEKEAAAISGISEQEYIENKNRTARGRMN